LTGRFTGRERRFFLIRDSVDHVAGRLDLTRYTIYNYLGDIRRRPAPPAR
jgi:predicted transcriptional regulator YheO